MKQSRTAKVCIIELMPYSTYLGRLMYGTLPRDDWLEVIERPSKARQRPGRAGRARARWSKNSAGKNIVRSVGRARLLGLQPRVAFDLVKKIRWTRRSTHHVALDFNGVVAARARSSRPKIPNTGE